MRFLCFTVLFLIMLAGCQTGENPTSSQIQSDRDWLGLALATEAFIKEGKYESPNGATWRMLPDSLDSKADVSLYSGMPGIVLFYLELFQATKDSMHLEEALTGADYLMNTLADTLPNNYGVGLYTGIAGVGYTLSEVYQISKEEKYKSGVLKTLELLEASAQELENGVQWGGINDIVYGAAGIGLYLTYLAETYTLPKADSLAQKTADGLITLKKDTLGGARWAFMPDYQRYMDNFSHGTAGVAYFLMEAHKRYGKVEYLNAASQSAQLLLNLSNEKGFIPHHFPDGEDLYYHSWCHGSAGTSRLFYALYQQTQDSKWLDNIKHPAQELMELGIDSIETPGFWNNEGKCCGSAGVAEYYLWLYDITGDTGYLAFAEKMTDRMLARSFQTDKHIKWVHAENRVSPKDVMAQTGLMQGSSGIGLWFLEMDARVKLRPVSIILPDKPHSTDVKVMQ